MRETIVSSTAQQFFDRFFRFAPPEIDVAAIQQEWLALKPPYQINERHLPLPVWARRGLPDTGPEAWAELRHSLNYFSSDKPLCIYIHIPFCAARCSFCDCYSFRLKRHRAKHIEEYIDLLAQEMRLWSQISSLARRPVSTIHFGGGTPTFMDEESLTRLAQNCSNYFNTTAQTEWALESTASELDDDMVSLLDTLNFTRLHLGVQSLEDPVRRLINRRESAAGLLRKITESVARKWIVSVDLIYGLPGQTLSGFLKDIKTLVEVGVDGFSLYGLQLSSRNRKFAEEHGLTNRNGLADYFLLQAASRLLTTLGYRKTLFNHFAREKDTNLYFTFPERGEDCLALGTIADGVFGDYHYRHPEYAAYRRNVSGSFPALQGGLRRDKWESRLRLLEIALMSGSIFPDLFADVLGSEQSNTLLRYWQESALVETDTRRGCLVLTANGSWFTGHMMTQLFTRNLL